MNSQKRILRIIAKNYSLDSDELLIALWDHSGFDYLKNENSVIKGRDYLTVVKKVIPALRSKKPLLKKEPKPVPIQYEDHDFGLVGKGVEVVESRYLTQKEILQIYDELVADFREAPDPIQPAGVKNESLLQSAAFHPTTSYQERLKYPTAASAAAALMYAISHNHAFHNGNKRTAIVAMLVFLDRHNISLTCSEDDLYKKSLDLADHKLVPPHRLYTDAEIYELAKWVHDNSKVMRRGERPITLKKLRQILGEFNAVILDSGRVQRTIQRRKSTFFAYKDVPAVLISTRLIGDSIHGGREIPIDLIKTIRKDLELDPDHGIDTEQFYGNAAYSTSDFIHKYRALLRRLAKR